MTKNNKSRLLLIIFCPPNFFVFYVTKSTPHALNMVLHKSNGGSGTWAQDLSNCLHKPFKTQVNQLDEALFYSVLIELRFGVPKTTEISSSSNSAAAAAAIQQQFSSSKSNLKRQTQKDKLTLQGWYLKAKLETITLHGRHPKSKTRDDSSSRLVT